MKPIDLYRKEFYCLVDGEIIGRLLPYYEAADFLKLHYGPAWLESKAKVRHVSQKFARARSGPETTKSVA